MKLKKLFVILIAGALFTIPFNTYGAVKLSDIFDLYGFIKLDAFYQDGGMNSVVAPRYAKPGDGNTAITAMNTRFGFKWKGAEIGSGWKIAAHLEWDLFDSSSANQMKFRTRHANFTLTKGTSKFLFGQFWDVFAPLGPTTLNTNGYFWQTGNIGFRRAQARFAYSSGNISFAFCLSDPTTAGARSTNLPVLQGRVGLQAGGKGKIKVGISGAYGKETQMSAGYETDVNIAGVCVDWNVALSKLIIMGEFTTGQNLGIFLSKAKVYNNVAAMDFEAMKVTAFWAEVLYKVKKLNIFGGYSFEKLTDNDQLKAGDYKDVSCIFAGIKLIAGKGVSFGLEFTHYLSKLFEGTEDYKTNQLIASFIYGF